MQNLVCQIDNWQEHNNGDESVKCEYDGNGDADNDLDDADDDADDDDDDLDVDNYDDDDDNGDDDDDEYRDCCQLSFSQCWHRLWLCCERER